MAEHAIELVQVALVLHQRGAREIIEVLDAAAGEVLVHRLHQREVLAQRDRDACGFQRGEELHEHAASLARERRAGKACPREGGAKRARLFSEAAGTSPAPLPALRCPYAASRLPSMSRDRCESRER